MKAELTEMERLKMENYALKVHMVQQQFQQLQMERAAFIHQLEKNHPGYEWREQEGLVRAEEYEAVDARPEAYPEFTPH